MKILILGAAGQLGCDIAASLSPRDELICPDYETLSVESEKSVLDFVSAIRPQVIINAAAFHDVERCEADPQRAFAVNTLGPLYMARAADAVGARLYHFSTDYVFNGLQGSPYHESDSPAPCNVYGHSKLTGECFVLAVRAGGYVLHVGALYGAHPCRGKGGRNFIRTMLAACRKRPEVVVVDDELITPTCTADVARQLSLMISSELAPGVYHATAQGMCTWFGFAQEIFGLLKLSRPLRPAKPGEFPVNALRPKMSVLENRRLADAGPDIMPNWRNALENFLTHNEDTISRWQAQSEASPSR
jgi:dTDP-4-dehydrorhamnose reductase